MVLPADNDQRRGGDATQSRCRSRDEGIQNSKQCLRIATASRGPMSSLLSISRLFSAGQGAQHVTKSAPAKIRIGYRIGGRIMRPETRSMPAQIRYQDATPELDQSSRRPPVQNRALAVPPLFAPTSSAALARARSTNCPSASNSSTPKQPDPPKTALGVSPTCRTGSAAEPMAGARPRSATPLGSGIRVASLGRARGDPRLDGDRESHYVPIDT